MTSHSPVIRKDMAIKLLRNEKHPFVSEFRMTRSSVQKHK